MFSGLRKISVYDPATGTVIQMNNISSEGSFSNQVLTKENGAGELLYCGNDVKFDFICLDDDTDIYDQLKAWTLAGTKINFVTYGVNEHLLWHELSNITVALDVKFKVGDRNGYKVTITHKGLVNNINIGRNLVFITKGVVTTDKWTADSYTISKIEGANRWELASDINPATIVATELIYPISGVPLVFAPGHDGAIADPLDPPTGTIKSKIAIKNFADAELSNTTTDYGEDTVLTTPANIYSIHLTPVYTESAASSLALIQPYLGIAIEQRPTMD